MAAGHSGGDGPAVTARITAVQIAELLDCHPATVRRWISRFNAEGAAGLDDRPRSGRPRLGDRQLTRRIAALLARPGPWTLPRIRRHLGWPQVSMRTLYRRVRLVAVWRRPKLTARSDPAHDHMVAGIVSRLLAPDMNEPLSRYNVTMTVACDGGSRPDPATFTAAADQAAWRRSASVISVHLADRIISVVTVTAPDQYAAVAAARPVVSDVLNRQALSSSHSADDRAQHRAEPAA